MLQAWQRATSMPAGRVRRGRILLLLDAGATVSQTARTMGMNRRFVYKWAQRFLAQGVKGLADKSGRGGGRRRARGTEEEQL